MPGGDWDQKPDLAQILRYGPYRTAVGGDPAPETLYYDAWANIHYGYVGRAHGIPADILRTANELEGGDTTNADRYSVEVGIWLWARYGGSLTLSQFRSAVARGMRYWRVMETYEVQPELRA